MESVKNEPANLMAGDNTNNDINSEVFFPERYSTTTTIQELIDVIEGIIPVEEFNYQQTKKSLKEVFGGKSDEELLMANEKNEQQESVIQCGYFQLQGTVLVKYTGNGDHVTIPEGVTSIGDSAFLGCTGLTSITIPEGVTSIGEWAFSECNGLTSVIIPAGVIIIGEHAFAACRRLASITISASVTTIAEDSFAWSEHLEEIRLGKGSPLDIYFLSDDMRIIEVE